MGKSCTKLAADALDGATKRLCLGSPHNVYRVDVGEEQYKQFHFEEWEEDDGGLKLAVYEHRLPNENEPTTIGKDPTAFRAVFSGTIRIGADGDFQGGPLIWAMALRNDPMLRNLIVPPDESVFPKSLVP